MSDAADFIGRGITFPLRVDQSGSIALGGGSRRHRRQHPHGAHHRSRRAGHASPVRLPHLEPPVRADQRQHPGADGGGSAATRSRNGSHESTLEDVDLQPDPDNPSRVVINLTYRVRSTNDRRNLVYPFYVIPKEVEP